ncbi:MAG: methyltransferase domain-containing protein [Candidatus Rokuibacteriota bacterium]
MARPAARMRPGTNRDGLRPLLACPVCKGGLEFLPGLIRCVACELGFPQSRDDCIDLFPDHLWAPEASRWEARQRETERAYRELIGDPAHAVRAYRNDYDPLAFLLAGYGGRVVDIGGGNGIVRHYLPPEAEYIVVDPSLDWLEPAWASISEAFPRLVEELSFVRGVGEYLPFRDETFDHALSIWSLNHVGQPEPTMREAWRVLRPRGTFLLVLDDVPPRWRDLVDGGFPMRDGREAARVIGRRLWAVIGGWPLQPDHLRISEADLRRWASPGFETIQRRWIGAYLTLELRKTGLHAR